MTSLALYALGSNENLINAAMGELKSLRMFKISRRGENNAWSNHSLYGRMEGETLHQQFLRETESTSDGNKWKWLKREELKRETKSFLCAGQD